MRPTPQTPQPQGIEFPSQRRAETGASGGAAGGGDVADLVGDDDVVGLAVVRVHEDAAGVAQDGNMIDGRHRDFRAAGHVEDEWIKWAGSLEDEESSSCIGQVQEK